MEQQDRDLCSALASRRLVSELIVIGATFRSSIRHHWRQGLAHKSHRSSHVAPAERRGHVAVDQRAARAGTPFRARANTPRPASFTRKAMNENVFWIAPVGVGAKNAATGRAATAKAPTMAVVGVRMNMQPPLRAAGAYRCVLEAARVPGPHPQGDRRAGCHTYSWPCRSQGPRLFPRWRGVFYSASNPASDDMARRGERVATEAYHDCTAHTQGKEPARKRHEGTLPFRPPECGGRAASGAGSFCRRRRSPRRGTGAWRRRAP